MLKGFEIINRENRPVRIYFRNADDEICIDEKFFIERTKVNVSNEFIEQQTKFTLDSLITKTKKDKTITEEVRESVLSDLKDKKYFDKLRQIRESQIIESERIKKGREEFKKYYNDIISFLEKKYKGI